MTRPLLFSMLIILICFGCSGEKGKIWMNDQINDATKEHIRTLNDKLFEAIKKNNVGAVQAMLSTQGFEAQGAGIEKLVANMHPAFDAQSYRILDNYHCRNTSTETIQTLDSGTQDDNAYLIQYRPTSSETCVSLWIPNGLDSDFLITTIYAMHDKQWQLDVLQFGQYGAFNRNAPYYYNDAKAFYANGRLTDALNNMEMAGLCLHPAGEYFVFQKEQEMKAFEDKLKEEFTTKFPLPLTLDKIETRPQVFKIHAGILSDGFFPMVSYLTSLPLDDTGALEAEHEKVKAEVNRLFTGINQDKKYVFYRAYHELPDGEKETDHFGFVDKDMK